MGTQNLDKKRTYERIAWLYDVLDLPFEIGRYRRLRRVIFDGLSGDLLDAGTGTGRNIPFYPKAASVTGIDLSPSMLALAGRRRKASGADVRLIEADVMDTPFADGRFQAIVATFLFCVLEPEHQQPALAELRRICRPGGEIRILEYSLPQSSLRRWMMTRIWAPWVRFAYGAAFDRNTEQYLEAAGLELISRRFIYRDIIKLLIARPKPAPDGG